MLVRALLCAALAVSLSACSTDVFSYSSSSVENAADNFSANSSANSSGAQQILAAEEPPAKVAHCERLADQRADDAVMGFYVSEGSQAHEAIHRETYRACVDWENRSANIPAQ